MRYFVSYKVIISTDDSLNNQITGNTQFDTPPDNMKDINVYEETIAKVFQERFPKAVIKVSIISWQKFGE